MHDLHITSQTDRSIAYRQRRADPSQTGADDFLQLKNLPKIAFSVRMQCVSRFVLACICLRSKNSVRDCAWFAWCVRRHFAQSASGNPPPKDTLAADSMGACGATTCLPRACGWGASNCAGTADSAGDAKTGQELVTSNGGDTKFNDGGDSERKNSPVEPCLLDYSCIPPSPRSASAIVLLEYARSGKPFRKLLMELGGQEDRCSRGHAFLSETELQILDIWRPNLCLTPRFVLIRADVEDQLALCLSTIPSKHRVVLKSRSVIVTEANMKHYFAAISWSMRFESGDEAELEPPADQRGERTSDCDGKSAAPRRGLPEAGVHVNEVAGPLTAKHTALRRWCGGRSEPDPGCEGHALGGVMPPVVAGVALQG